MTLTYAFTSRIEIERTYSTIGVTLRLDDLQETGPDHLEQTNSITEIIEAATETVASYTLRYYNNSAIYNSPWIRRRTTIIACYYLSMRRANGTQFTREYERVMDELERFNGYPPPIIPGPNGNPAPVRTSMIPTVSAYIVDDRNRYVKLKVKQAYSTKPYPGQYRYNQVPSNDCH